MIPTNTEVIGIPDPKSPDMVDIEIGDTDKIKFKCMTWNLWCMVFAPRTLSNPQRCSDYLLNIADRENWNEFDGLIICNFQEAWSWKTGLFPPILLRLIAYFEYIPYFGVFISFIFQFITLLFGLLPIFKCLPIFKYNPKAYIASKLHKFVPYSYWNINIPFKNILDNGLLLLSNHKADRYGSNGYVHKTCGDSLAYKGFIYAYFEKYHLLVINTHLDAAIDGTERLLQIREIKQFIDEFDNNYNNNKKLKVILCGDWNVDMTNYDEIDPTIYRSPSYADLPTMFGSTFKKTNGCNPTCNNEKWGCLDHIFANFEIESFEEEIHGKDGKLSDHLLIKNEFTSSHSNLNHIIL